VSSTSASQAQTEAIRFPAWKGSAKYRPQGLPDTESRKPFHPRGACGTPAGGQSPGRALPGDGGERSDPAAMAKAIAFATAPGCPLARRGPKPPASARPGGRWPAVFEDLPVYRVPSSAGGGIAMRFLSPPRGGAEGLAAFQLPRRYGKGHCLCNSATLPLGPPGAKAPGGRFAPAGSGAGLRCSWTCR
jgi:hypothetical protein